MSFFFRISLFVQTIVLTLFQSILNRPYWSKNIESSWKMSENVSEGPGEGGPFIQFYLFVLCFENRKSNTRK